MFWFLHFNSLPGAQLWNDEADDYLQDINCSYNPDHNSSTRTWKPAIFREETTQDVVLNGAFDAYFTARSSFVLRNAVFNRLTETGLTGWIRNPAQIRYADGRISDDFGELWIKGFSGIADAKSGCSLLWKCRTCGNTRYKPGFSVPKAIEEMDWDGSDFFTLWPLVNYRFCTDRAKRIIEEFKVGEIRFRRPEELSRPLQIYGDAPIPPFYKPEARAQVERFWASAPPAPPK